MICLLRQMYACTFVHLCLRIQVLAVDLHLQCRARARGQHRKWDSVQLPLIGSTSLARQDQVPSTRPLTTSLGFFSSSSFFAFFHFLPPPRAFCSASQGGTMEGIKITIEFFFFLPPCNLDKARRFNESV